MANQIREAQVKILANMVFRYQGSDPEVQTKQVGIKEAADTLQEILDEQNTSLRNEIIEELAGLYKDMESSQFIPTHIRVKTQDLLSLVKNKKDNYGKE